MSDYETRVIALPVERTMTAARKLPPPQQEPAKRSKLYDLMMQQMESADMEGYAEIERKYGGDFERELGLLLPKKETKARSR